MKNGQFFVGEKSYENNSWAIQAHENGWRYVCGTYGNGIKIIRDIAGKYNGHCDFYEEENMFCCLVVLIPNEK